MMIYLATFPFSPSTLTTLMAKTDGSLAKLGGVLKMGVDQLLAANCLFAFLTKRSMAMLNFVP
jgi:hypothetical protein